jgi:hypothetical protein
VLGVRDGHSGRKWQQRQQGDHHAFQSFHFISPFSGFGAATHRDCRPTQIAYEGPHSAA